MGTKLFGLLCSAVLAFALTLPGCMTMPDGSSEPDYTMIEFGAVAVFTVLINETKVSDEKVLEAYRGLSNLESTLQSMIDSGEPLDLAIVDQMLANAVPVEYQALTAMGSKLIRQRAKLYLGESMPDVDLGKYALVGKIAQSVVSGAKAAIEPKAFTIK